MGPSDAYVASEISWAGPPRLERDGALKAAREAVDIRRAFAKRWPRLKADLDASVEEMVS
jgi:hypothetical protein